MKKNLLLILCAILSMQVQAQTVIGHQNVDQFPTDAGGTLKYGLTWLPVSYSSSPTKKYPLIIYLHGSKQAGTGLAGLNKLITYGLPQKIAAGFQPTAVNPKDGQTYEFIVVSPQDPSWTPTYTKLKYIVPNILSRYQVDTNRIYLTGTATGGDGVFTCLGSNDSSFIKHFAGAATSSSEGVEGVNGLTDVQVEAQFRYATKKYGVQVWTVLGDQDGTIDTDVRYHDSLNVAGPAIPDKLTVISGVSNSATKQYDSAFRPILNFYGNTANCSSGCTSITAPNTNGSPRRGSGATQDSLNLFEWFLLSQRNGSLPTANAGGNQTITLPVNSVTLSGSGTPGSGHTISSYGWIKLTGGAATITSPSSASTTVTGLVQGAYTFRLTVTNNISVKASSDVTITVNAGSSCAGIKYILTPDPVDSSVYIATGTSPSSGSYHPGDSLVLNSAYSSIDLQGLHGSSSCPVVIVNQTRQALITKRLNLDGCTYIKVTGSGTAAQYGILIQQDPQLRQQSFNAIQVNDKSKDIEIERVSMHNVDIGIVAETNEDCDTTLDYPNWILDSLNIHDNKITGTWNEGMYIGNTSPDNASYDLRPVVCNGKTYYYAPMKNGYAHIYNNIVDSTGRGGIQLANAAYGISEINGNTVKHNGLNGDEAQGTAISLGLYTRAYVHNNTVSTTLTWGIVSLGAGATGIPVRIEHNTIDSTGYLKHYDLATTNRIVYDPRTETVYADTLNWPQSIEIDTRPRLYTTDKPHPGTAVHGQDSTQFQIKTNTVGLKKNAVAINVDDDYAGIQKSGNTICGNLNAGTGTAAVINVASGINYTTNCSGGSVARMDLLTANAASLENPSARFVQVSPNPIIQNSVIVTAQNERTGRVIVWLYDVNGRLVQEKVFTKQGTFFRQELILPNLARGMYLLKLQFAASDKPSIFKLIKE